MLKVMDSSIPRHGTGRWLAWLGVLCALVGAPLYAVQLSVAGRTDTPWYLPILGTLGLLFAFAAVRRRRTVWRTIVLLFVVGLAAAQWWFLLSYVREPAYNGPLAAGQPFPTFAAKRADGSAVTGADLWNHAVGFRGDKADVHADRATALVFFRGRW
jgi:hypothetical protein